jgi:K+-sensing histidine kinase KdpD
MSPFRPLIKLLILPVYDEFQQTVGILHNANLRIDRLAEVTDRDRHNAVVRFDRLREYTKLLHSLSHNLVVELTKLKIENDTLKARLEILEKDFDFLGKRERALEREVLE